MNREYGVLNGEPEAMAFLKSGEVERDHIEEIEIATPITSMRYLGTQKGSIYAYDHFIKDSDHFIRNETHIKGLHGVGGWFGMIGFQPTLTSGVVTAKAVMKELN